MTTLAATTPADFAAVYPARPCQWCGRSFTARDRWEAAPGTGGTGYVHAGSGRIGDPDCGGELAAALELREADAWAALPFGEAA